MKRWGSTISRTALCGPGERRGDLKHLAQAGRLRYVREDGPSVRTVIRSGTVAVFLVVPCALGASCGRQPAAGEAYVPGLGEMMTLQQMRHVKLWLAGEAGNWELAGY